MLEKLIQTLILDSYLSLTIEEKGVLTTYSIYLLHLYHEKGSWLIDGFNVNTEKKQILPIHNLADVEPYTERKRLTRKKIMEKIREQEVESNLMLELGPKAIVQFKKYHPLKMSLAYTNPYQTTAILKTFVDVANSEEVMEITNWVLFLGEDMMIREMPGEIRETLKRKTSLYCSR